MHFIHLGYIVDDTCFFSKESNITKSCKLEMNDKILFSSTCAGL